MSVESDPMKDWSDNIKNYQMEKTKMGYSENPQYNSRIKHKDMKEAEGQYNPIL